MSVKGALYADAQPAAGAYCLVDWQTDKDESYSLPQLLQTSTGQRAAAVLVMLFHPGVLCCPFVTI